MKIQKIIHKIFTFIAVMLAVSCTDDFESMNTDPNRFDNPRPSSLFNGAIRETYSHIGGAVNNEIYLSYSGYIGARGGLFGVYSLSENFINRYYQSFYTDIIVTLRTFINKNEGAPQYSNIIQIAKVWEAYVYSVLVSTFGPVPYSDAIGSGLTAKFDSEIEIYTGVLETLKTAANTMDIDGDKFVVDPIYNGSISQWIKFTNSLRLKIALRISSSAEMSDLSIEHLNDVMLNENEMLESNQDNAVLVGESANVLNWSYAYTKYIFNTNTNLNSYPVANFHFLLNLKTLKDPRLEVYHDIAKDSLSIIDEVFKSGSTTEKIAVSYKIPHYGTTISGTATLNDWGLVNADSPYQGVATDAYSRPEFNKYFSEEAPYNIITAAETYFLKAEAKHLGALGTETVESYYYKGIDRSFEQLELSSDVTTYKEQAGVKWGTSNPGIRDIFGAINSSVDGSNPLDQIVRQRWIAMFYQGHDAWCLTRRTRLVPVQAHYNPNNSVTPRTREYAEVPERLVYPPSERGSNYENYLEAITLLGGDDNLITPLKISIASSNDPQRNPALETRNAEFNYDFASGWYGESEDDLIAKGVTYELLIIE